MLEVISYFSRIYNHMNFSASDGFKSLGRCDIILRNLKVWSERMIESNSCSFLISKTPSSGEVQVLAKIGMSKPQYLQDLGNFWAKHRDSISF